MRFFLVGQLESDHQTIFVDVDTDDLLRNEAAILTVCIASTWFAALTTKMLLHRSDDNVFDFGRGNAGDRADR
jgi:hypothetical protein